MIAHMLNIAVGLTFSGGSPRLLPVWYSSGKCKDTAGFRVIPVGIIYFLLILFHFQIHDPKSSISKLLVVKMMMSKSSFIQRQM